jgi:hypothetical protein
MLLEKVEIPPFLRDKLYADFTSPEKYEQTFPKILTAMGINIECNKTIVKDMVKKDLKSEMTVSEQVLTPA